MEVYTQSDIEHIQDNLKDNYYVPESFFSAAYSYVRLEIKWAFVSCLNVLVQSPLYDEKKNAYIDDYEQVMKLLRILANKRVDVEKIQGYMTELEDYKLIIRDNEKIYLKRI